MIDKIRSDLAKLIIEGHMAALLAAHCRPMTLPVGRAFAPDRGRDQITTVFHGSPKGSH